MTTQVDEVVERIASEQEDQETGTPIYRIRSYPSDPELETLHARWRRGDIVIPSFQRGFVWKPTQASRLIESFLMGLPVPEIFVFVQEPAPGERTQKQLVIDGQQRLRSVFGFFEGKLPDGRDFRLTGVDDRWEGKQYDDLEASEQNTLLTSVLRVVNIEQRAPKGGDSIFQIFERLNTGGTTLTAQEIRNSSYHGPFNKMLVEVNNNPMWRSIFGTPQPDARMRDIELIARFLALHERANSYSKPMKKFINDYMSDHQWAENPEEFRSIFLESVNKVTDSLGERPFHIRRGINVAAFDSVMVAFSRSEKVPQDITERYESLTSDQKFMDSITSSTTDVNIVQERLRLAHRVLFQ